jgi:hypothetical protein
MAFFSKLFRRGRLSPERAVPSEDYRAKADPQKGSKLNALIAQLVSLDDAVFVSGLTEAVALSQRGDQTGLQAIREAIVRRSGRSDFIPYQPGVRFVSGDSLPRDTRKDLMDLAAKKQLLKDPRKSEELISWYNITHSPQDVGALIDDVFRVGGAGEFYAIQLLYHDPWCYVQLEEHKG